MKNHLFMSAFYLFVDIIWCICLDPKSLPDIAIALLLLFLGLYRLSLYERRQFK